MSVALYAFCLISLVSSSETAGEQCKVYQVPIRGKALRGHTYESAKAGELFRCYARCERDPACKSCNFKHTQETCELNNETEETKPNDFITDEQSYYIKGTGGDVNECENVRTYLCDKYAFCNNTKGSCSFHCKQGFVGDGFNSTVPQPVILFPLNAEYQTSDIKNRTAPGIPSGVTLAPGPCGKEDGSYEFFGNASSFIEFTNSPGGALDVRYSMTILCWVYYDEKGGPDGPIFNYYSGDKYGVHLWVIRRLLFARFKDRAFSSYPHLLNTFLAGGWKFVGASYDNETGDIKLWADGALKQTRNIGAHRQLATQGSVRMGVRKNDNRYFKGRISQLQIYNEPLSQQQILKLATGDHGG